MFTQDSTVSTQAAGVEGEWELAFATVASTDLLPDVTHLLTPVDSDNTSATAGGNSCFEDWHCVSVQVEGPVGLTASSADWREFFGFYETVEPVCGEDDDDVYEDEDDEDDDEDEFFPEDDEEFDDDDDDVDEDEADDEV